MYPLGGDERRSCCHHWISFWLGRELRSYMCIPCLQRSNSLFLTVNTTHSQGFALAVQCRVKLGMNVMLSDIREDKLKIALNKLRYISQFSGMNVQIQT